MRIGGVVLVETVKHPIDFGTDSVGYCHWLMVNILILARRSLG